MMDEIKYFEGSLYGFNRAIGAIFTWWGNSLKGGWVPIFDGTLLRLIHGKQIVSFQPIS